MGAYKGKVSTKMVLDIYVLPAMLNIPSKSYHVSVVWLEMSRLMHSRSVVASVAMAWAMSFCMMGQQKGCHASEYSVAP